MTDNSWNISAPAEAATIGSIPGHIRTTRDQVATHLNVEHEDFASGADESDMGCQHREGSAKVFVVTTAPTNRPGDGTVALTAADEGRLWVNSSDGMMSWWDGDSWEEVTIAGGVGGSGVTLLAGRAGGQHIEGGTLTTQGLTLSANAVEDATGTILFEGAQTEFIDFDDIPLKNTVLGEALSGASTDGDDGFQIRGVKKASIDHDVLTKGAASIVLADLATTGGVGSMCWGTVAEDGTERAADVGFAPDLVIVANDVNHANHPICFWFRGMTTNNKGASGAYGAESTYGGISVSGDVVTFGAESLGGNHSGASNIWYLAIKFNKQVNPTTPA